MSSLRLLERKDIGRVEAEIKYVAPVRLRNPVTVDGDKLEIDSARLQVQRVYNFDYLGAKMVLWKSPQGTVDVYQVVE